jgi:hypothetical protein
MKFSWVHDLQSPAKPGDRTVDGKRVHVLAQNIRLAEEELKAGKADAIFNAFPSGQLIDGTQKWVLGTLAAE